MEANTKRKLAVGAAAAILAAGGGAALAASKFGSPKEESQAVIADAAKQLGIEPSKLSNALKKALENRVDAAVASGSLTKAEGEALKARIDSGELPLFAGGPPHGPGLRHDGPGLAAAATYLGLTEAQLRDELQGGKTLAQIATAHGKTVDGLVAALLNDAKSKLDQAVADGRLTRAQADEMLAGLKARITDFVNGRFPPSFRDERGRHGFAFRHDGLGFDAAATYLGLSETQLRAQLESGKTLAQIATAQGKTVDGLVGALLDRAKQRLDKAVAAGRLTREEADGMLAGLKERIAHLVNSRFGAPFRERGARGFRAGPPAFFGRP
jgi:hypothetical protein